MLACVGFVMMMYANMQPFSLDRIMFTCQWKSIMWMKEAYKVCHSPSLGLATKAKTCKGASQEWSLGVAFHILRSVGEWGNELPHSQMSSHFGS